jgi:transposase InsO family protein
MAAEILTHPTRCLTEGSTSFAELGVLYGEKGVAEAQSRLQVVLEFKSLRPKSVHLNGQRVPSLASKELARKTGVSLGTLWRWYRLYRSAYASAQGNVHGKAKAGFEALIPRQRGRTEDLSEDRRYKVDEELRRAIAGLYARRKRPSITKVWRKLIAQCPQCRERSLEPRVKGYQGKNRMHSCPECSFSLSYSTVRRIVKTIPPAVRVLGREGAQAFRNRYGIYIPRSYADLRNREIFCGDHHEFDLFVHTRSGKLIRPWISAWQDLKTGVLTGWFISERPSSQTIALAFRHAVLPKDDGIMGLPESIYVDNGKDFRSRYLEGHRKHLGRIPADSVDLFARAHGLGVLDMRAMEGIWRNLGLKVRHTIPYNAQAKPIERFFGTLERDFVQELPGWCGSKLALRPVDILKQQIRKHQAWLKGEAEETPFLHLAEFALLFERWLHEHYLRSPHARLGCSPLEAYKQEYGTPVVPDERTLDLLLMRAEQRLVRRNGLELFERNRWYWSEKLVGREGTYVEVRWDPRNLGKVLVYTEEGFLCEAFNLELASFHPSLEQLREYKRMKKLQREVALAHLELMHLAADGLTALDLVRGGPRRHSVRSQRAELAPRAGSNGQGPIFTSQAARQAWEAEQRRPGGDGYGHS